MTTCSTVGQFSSARSALCFRGTTVPRRQPPSAVMRTLRLGVVDAVRKGVRGEPAEDDVVDGADAGAGEHGHRRLQEEGHVDGHPVPLRHAQVLQAVGELAHLPVQLQVGEGADIAVLPLPDQRGLVPPRALQVPVKAVVAEVELAADEPPGMRRVPVQHLVQGLNQVSGFASFSQYFWGSFAASS